MEYEKNYEKWLKYADKETKAELESIKDDENEIKERFSIPLAFGTAGMRGVLGAGMFRMNKYTVRQATHGLARMIADGGAKEMKKGVVIAYDTRNKSFEFALEAAKVLSANGIRTYIFENVRPVPVCSFAVRHLGCAAGIMITASHNPKEYNGYKVYGPDGAQMSPEDTAKVVDYISRTNCFGIETLRLETEKRAEITGKDKFWLNDYTTVIGQSVDIKYFAAIEKLRLSPDEVERTKNDIRIVYTPIHGSGLMPVSLILKMMGIPFTVVKEQAEPDINFSTVSMPNPEQPEALLMGMSLAERIKGDIVIGTDPDCDRMGAAVRKPDGRFLVLTGNQIGVLLMDYILKRNTDLGKMPKNPAVVKTIVTTNLADKVAESYGAKLFSVLTGFKFIGEKIKEWEATGQYTFMFGYEESFGYLSGTHARDKDAVVVTMLFAEMACYYKANGLSVYEVLEGIWQKHGYFEESNRSIAFAGVSAMDDMAEVMKKLRENPLTDFGGIKIRQIKDYTEGIDGLPKTNVLKYCLDGASWAAVRPSGTEPKLKVYVSAEGKTQEEAEALNKKLHTAIAKLV